MRKVHVNYNDGNQISLPQQRSMQPREKFEIKEGAGSKDYPLAFGMTTIIRLLKKIALWLYGNWCSDLSATEEKKGRDRL